MTFAARELAERLGLKRAMGGVWRGACPACGYPTTFTVRERDGRVLWWCASCQDKSGLAAAVRAAMGEEWTPPPPAERRSPDRGTSPARRSAFARKLWLETVPIGGTLAERYLTARSVLAAWQARPMPEHGEQLRFHPAAPHPAAEGRFPSLVALVRRAEDGEPVAVHRTYLAPDGSGKAAVEPQKATLGPVAGGVVMLHGPATDAPLVLAEGIETALAASALMNAPAWAAVAAGNLANLTLSALPAAADVLIAADADAPGQEAAWAASRRWRAEGRRVRVATPDQAGRDFADILAAQLRAQEIPDAR
jgi:putative DNA primase/helicase